ncbi:MAG: hypothetical protein J6333_02650, partial [Planctomycetes bacterium]|nr:hypothetical protein [Planctomycetota bacterium]
MKKLMFATALVASAAAFADPLNANSFEGYNVDDRVGNTADVGGATSGMYFYFDGDQDGSLVKAFGSGEGQIAAPGITRPLYFASADPNAKYLELSTEGGILWRSISTVNSDTSGESPVYSLGNPVDIAATGTYLDTLVQFTPTEDGGAPEVTQDDKLAIWLNVDSSGAAPVTNLMVKAGSYDNEGTPVVGGATYVLSGKTIVAGEWYRLTIKAIDDILPPNESFKIPGFQVFVDSVPMVATTSPISTTFVGALREAEMITAEQQTAINSGAYLPSLVAGTPNVASTLQGVGFKGSGALDDVVWTEEDPFAAVALDFTLTWPAGVTPVSYTIGNGDGVAFAGTETSPLHINGVMSGDTVAFTFTNADGATKTMSLEAAAGATDIDASTAVYEWADYLGAAVNGAYTIDDANDLDMLRKGVAANLATLGETFKQTANIDMTSAAAFAGIGTYAAAANAGLPFEGTYDGQGFTISNITFTDRDYAGVFNQVKGGAIKN